MTNKKVTRRALLMSVTSLLICISMLLGTTFAWFTDEVTSGVNQIVAGNLDVELYHTNPATASNASDEAKKVGSTTKLFQTAIGTDVLWEPEAMTYETFEVRNVGTLALKYQLMLNDVLYNIVTWAADNTAGVAAGEHNLTEVIQIGIIDGATAPTRADIRAAETQTIKQAMDSSWVAKTSALEPGASQSFTVVLYWPQSSADNNWNLKNTGWTLTQPTVPTGYSWSHAKELAVEFGVKLLATQQTSESDSFDNTYDASADGTEAWTGVTEGTANADVTGDSDKTATVTVPVTPAASGYTTVKLENADSDGALDNATSVKLDVETTDVLASSVQAASNPNFVASSEGLAVASLDLTLTVTKTTTATDDEGNETITSTSEQATNGFTATVETFITKNLSYPVTVKYGNTETWVAVDENSVAGADTASYDPVTGKLSFVTNHFSEYVVFSNIESYNETTDTAYGVGKLETAFGDVEDAGSIILLKDTTQSNYITVNDQKIIFDLNGKTISTTSGCTSVFIPYHNNAELTIKDSAGSGKILYSGTATAANQTAIRVWKGRFILNGGTIESVPAATAKAPVYVQSTGTFIMNGGQVSGLTYGLNNSGTVTINGGLVKSTQTDKTKWSYGIYAAGTVNINGGEVQSALIGVYTNGATVNVDGGTVSGSKGIMGKGTVNLKSGSINVSDIGISEYNNTQTLRVTMSGGEIISPNVGISLQKSSSLNMSGGKISITGMEAGKTSTFGIYGKDGASITISGDALIENLNLYGTDSNDNKCTPYGIDLETGTDTKNTTLNLNAGTISVPNGYGVSLGEYANATIENGTIIAVNAITSWRSNATCEITDGSFNADNQVCYAYEGFFEISGGTFTGKGSSNVEDNIYRYTLNCYDASYTADPATAGFTVTGGTFYQFNPQNDLSEGENTCFTPEGYHAEYNEETGYYTIVPTT